MPKDEFDPEDPMELVGVELPSGSEEGLRKMALTFAEEFIRGGMSEDRVLALFKNPFYRGPYLVWQRKGDTYVKQVIQEAVQMWWPNSERGQAPFGGLAPFGGQANYLGTRPCPEEKE